MLDRFGPPRTALAVAGAVVAAFTASAPAAAASAPAAAAAGSPPASGGTIGGAQLAGRGVIVSYPSGPAAKLPVRLVSPRRLGL